MKNLKNTLLEILTTKGTHFLLSDEQDRVITNIKAAIDYAWNNWDEKIITTYFEGEKPEFANVEFITNWLDNSDLEADGFDVEKLKELFA